VSESTAIYEQLKKQGQAMKPVAAAPAIEFKMPVGKMPTRKNLQAKRTQMKETILAPV